MNKSIRNSTADTEKIKEKNIQNKTNNIGQNKKIYFSSWKSLRYFLSKKNIKVLPKWISPKIKYKIKTNLYDSGNKFVTDKNINGIHIGNWIKMICE